MVAFVLPLQFTTTCGLVATVIVTSAVTAIVDVIIVGRCLGAFLLVLLGSPCEGCTTDGSIDVVAAFVIHFWFHLRQAQLFWIGLPRRVDGRVESAERPQIHDDALLDLLADTFEQQFSRQRCLLRMQRCVLRRLAGYLVEGSLSVGDYSAIIARHGHALQLALHEGLFDFQVQF